MNKIIVIIITLLGITSCSRSLYTGSSSNLYETFYRGGIGTQYFIKPLEFYGSEKDEFILADFTFVTDNKLKEKDSVFLNFTLQTKDIVRQIDALIIQNSTLKTGSMSSLDKLFLKKKKDYFVIRYTTKISLVKAKQLFGDSHWSISTSIDGSTLSYAPSKKNQRKINSIYENVFFLID
jgi:hypothetical protein